MLGIFTKKQKERREDRRIDANEPSRLIIPGEMEMEVPATLVNFSQSGLAVLTSYPVKIGTVVLIQWDALFFVGKVKRCLAKGEECQVGVQLDVTRDNERAMSQLWNQLAPQI